MKRRKILYLNSCYTVPWPQRWAASCCQYPIMILVKLHVYSCCCPLSFRDFIVQDSGTNLSCKKELEGIIHRSCAYRNPLLSSHCPWSIFGPNVNHVFLFLGYVSPCEVLHFLVQTLSLRPHPPFSDRHGFAWCTEFKSPSWVCCLLQHRKNVFNLKIFLIFTRGQDTERLLVM